MGEDVTAASFFLKLVNNALMVLANEHGHVQGHVQKINYKIKTDVILMPIIYIKHIEFIIKMIEFFKS